MSCHYHWWWQTSFCCVLCNWQCDRRWFTDKSKWRNNTLWTHHVLKFKYNCIIKYMMTSCKSLSDDWEERLKRQKWKMSDHHTPSRSEDASRNAAMLYHVHFWRVISKMLPHLKFDVVAELSDPCWKEHVIEYNGDQKLGCTAETLEIIEHRSQ